MGSPDPRAVRPGLAGHERMEERERRRGLLAPWLEPRAGIMVTYNELMEGDCMIRYFVGSLNGGESGGLYSG